MNISDHRYSRKSLYNNISLPLFVCMKNIALGWVSLGKQKIYLYFSWEDQRDSTYCIFHTILISCITVLYESYRKVVRLIGQIQNAFVAEDYLRNIT